MDNLTIIERSIYQAILEKLISLKYTLDPKNYYPITSVTELQFEQDLQGLIKYIPVFGASNSESKGTKTTPRIVIDSHGFYQGNIGLPKIIEMEAGNSIQTVEVPYETLDQFIDVRLVSSNQEENRLLHTLLFYSVPYRGYIKPYNKENLGPSGNIFLEVVNFFDNPDLSDGIIEKVYQFRVSDFIIDNNNEEPITLPKLTEVDLEINNNNITFKQQE